MGWNDRVENNPYEPYPDYTEQDHYEAWMHYQDLCRHDRPTSQNIDPADFAAGQPATLFSRIIDRLLGQTSGQESQKNQPNQKQQETEIPF